MRKNRLNRNNENSIFELLSDISLSTLGLFLIFFVVYSLVFNSSATFVDKINDLNNKVSNLNNEVAKVSAENSRLNNQNSQLLEDRSRLSSDNERLRKKLTQANQRVDNAEREKQDEIQKNRYTGYYKAQYQAKFYYNGCYNDYNIIQQEHNLIYLQNSNTMVYSTKSEKGIITYHINGTLQDNTFKGNLSDHLKTQKIDVCNSDNQQIIIVFFEDYLDRTYANYCLNR